MSFLATSWKSGGGGAVVGAAGAPSSPKPLPCLEEMLTPPPSSSGPNSPPCFQAERAQERRVGEAPLDFTHLQENILRKENRLLRKVILKLTKLPK